ncbi:MAG: hypothetical protein RLZZ301_85 [Bacteroidota bacterium]|jgi:hypothetical protein
MFVRFIFTVVLSFLFSCGSSNQTAPHKSLEAKPSEQEITSKAYHGAFKIYPSDESANDPTLLIFLKNLKKVVAKKDTSGLFKILDSEIVVSYGGALFGIKEFSTEWQLNFPNQSKLWPGLKRILSLGGTFEDPDKHIFCIPYTHSDKAFNKLNYDFNWYLTAVCISNHVIVYQAPKTKSTRLATLSYDVVEIIPEDDESGFIKIQTLDKKVKGYVKEKDLILTSAPSLGIIKKGNNWKITEYAPYD